MKKNVGSQTTGAQMITAADGSAFTGTVTVVIDKDGGGQGASAGTGPTHIGSGWHQYLPTQGETNADHIAFTYTGTGAIPTTIQVWTSFPQTGDNFARLGAPAGASVSADVAAVKVDTAAVKTKTDSLTFTVAAQVDANVLDWKSATAPAMTGDAFARLGAPAGASVSADIAAINVLDTAIKAKTDNLPSAIKKNTALSNFEFLMVLSTDHTSPATGLTVAVSRSIDGAAFGAATNTPATEVSNGIYKINLSAADLNGDTITIRCTSATADDTFITIFTKS